MEIKSTAGTEGNGGYIHDNFFFGPGSATGSQGAAIYSEVGYCFIHDNVFTGGAGAIDINANTGPAGAVTIHDNTIEDYRVYGINISTADHSPVSMVRVHDNEFSNVSFGANVIAAIYVAADSGAYLNDLSIRGNIIRAIHSATASIIYVQSGTGVIIADNICDNIGGAAMQTAIGCTGTYVTAPAAVLDNQIIGTYTTKYSLSVGTVLRDMTTGLAVAELGAWGNGSSTYATNGQATTWPTNRTLIAGGPGCVAFRQVGAWLAT